MALKETVSKIAKGVGKGLKNNVVTQDIEAVMKSSKKFGTKFSNKFLEDVPVKDSYDSLMHAVLPKQLKRKYVYGAVGAGVTYSIASGIGNLSERASYGKIEGGGLSHMASEVSSTLISEMQQGNYDPSRIMHNSSYRDTSATGDIVMALHNRR